MRLHGFPVDCGGAGGYRRVLRQRFCRRIQSVALDARPGTAARQEGSDRARCAVQRGCSRHDSGRSDLFLPYAVLRTVLIPCCYLALLCLLRVSEWSAADASIGTVVLLCAACPSAASSVLMTASLGMDSAYGSRIILMTSILSVISIPILSFLSVLLL